MTRNEHKYLAMEVLYSHLSEKFPDRFLVTGSFANQAWLGKLGRPIGDLDLLETQRFDAVKLQSEIRTLIESLPNEHDVVWAKDRLTQTTIFEDSNVPGVRSTLPFAVQSEADVLQIDIAMQDPLTQSPVTVFVPSLVHGTLNVRTVPAETAAAWKLHGLFEHLDGRWLTKSLIDLYRFIKSGSLSEVEFRIAVLMAFQSRLDPIVCLNRLLNGNFGLSKLSQQNWEKETDAIGEDAELDAVLETVRAFVRPLFSLSHANEIASNSELIEHRVRLLHELKTPAAETKLAGLKARLKVLPKKAYNKIGHLPESRSDDSDRHIHPRESARLTETCPPDCEIIVQEKLDGSSVAAYRRGRRILPLGRLGDLTYGSRNASRRMWADWVKRNEKLFLDILSDGERLCGEWLAMVHAVRYEDLAHPFFAFDLFESDGKRLSYDALLDRLDGSGIPTPTLLHRGGALSVDAAIEILDRVGTKSSSPPEGAVWRMERDGVPKLIAKYVRPEFEPGSLLEEHTGRPAEWNWRLDLDALRYSENARLSKLMRKNGNARVIGFDDAPHKRLVDATIHINGIVTNRSTFEGMISGVVDASGLDATFVLADLVLNSKFRDQVHAILIDGITFAFNTVDLPALHRMTDIPVIAVMRHEPDMEKIHGVIDKYCRENEAEYKRIYASAGTVFQHDNLYFQCCGLSEAQSRHVLDQTTVNGNVPEPLRIAHLIGSSIKTGQSSGRA